MKRTNSNGFQLPHDRDGQDAGIRASAGVGRWQRAARGLVWLTTGTLIGLAITLAVSRSFAGLLYGVEPLDPLTLVAAVLLLCAVGCVASLVPVYRAPHIDPLTALRFE